MASPSPELVDFIRKHRGVYPDKEIWARLIEDGVDPEHIREAFRRAAPAPGRSRRTILLALGAGAIAGAALLAGLLLWSGGRERLLIEEQIPRGVPGNAGEDFGRAAELSGGRLPASAAEADWAPLAPAVAALEGAVGKRENRTAGVLATPASIEEVLELSARHSVVGALAQLFLIRGHRLRAAGSLEGAAAEYRKALAVGYLLLRDWEPTARREGLRLAADGAGALEIALEKGAGGAAPLRRAELLGQLERRYGTPAEFAQVRKDTGDPEGLGGILLKHLGTPAKLEKLVPWVLLGTALNWSEAEVRSGGPSPRRAKLLAALAEYGGDPRCAALARGYAAVLDSLARRLASEPPEVRAAVLERLQRGFFEGRPDSPLERSLEAAGSNRL